MLGSYRKGSFKPKQLIMKTKTVNGITFEFCDQSFEEYCLMCSQNYILALKLYSKDKRDIVNDLVELHGKKCLMLQLAGVLDEENNII